MRWEDLLAKQLESGQAPVKKTKRKKSVPLPESSPYLDFIALPGEEQWERVLAGEPVPVPTEADERVMRARQYEGQLAWEQLKREQQAKRN